MEKIKSVKQLIQFAIENDIDEIDIKELIEKIDFELKYENLPLKGEITQPYLDMLQKYQEATYFAYLAVNGKREDLRLLKDSEKQALSLKYKVEEGSNIVETALEHPDLIAKVLEDMTGSQKVVIVLIVFGYLTVSKLLDYLKSKAENARETERDKVQAEREEKLYETFQEVVKVLPEKRIFEEEKEDALIEPVLQYEGSKLKTEEIEIDTQKAKEIVNKRTLPEKEEIIKEGCFIVDGIKGATSTSTTYYLKTDDEEISIKLGDTEADIAKRAFLFKHIGKIVFAKIKIVKQDKAIKEKYILEVMECEDIEIT